MILEKFRQNFETCLNNEREAPFPCLYMYMYDMPEATYISLSLRAASVWLRHLASGLRPSLLTWIWTTSNEAAFMDLSLGAGSAWLRRLAPGGFAWIKVSLKEAKWN